MSIERFPVVTARKRFAPSDRTCWPGWPEGGVHAIGYQLAQASIVTDQVFDEQVGRNGERRGEYTVLALVQGNPRR